MLDEPRFDDQFEENIVINRPIEEVYQALYDLTKWSKYLPHVKSIEILYDDGMYQEFRMHVLSKEDKTISVRSVRRCQRDDIRYFQPEPPKFLKHHAGQWKLNKKENNSCAVMASHMWTIDRDRVGEIFQDNSTDVDDHVRGILKDHAKFALVSWKKVLEQGDYQ